MKTNRILIVDDEKDIRSLMQEILLEEGYAVETAANGEQARQAWQKQLPEIVFLDIWMPDIDGISLLKQMADEEVLRHAKVIMMSGHGTIETAIEATKLGAYDFLEKPLSLAKLIVTAERAIEHNQLNQENRQLKEKQPQQILPVGKSKTVGQLRETIERLSRFTMSMLISGEAGSGKQYFAEAIHKTSQRSQFRFKEIYATDFNQLCLPENASHLKDLLRQVHLGSLVISHIEQLNRAAQAVIATLVLAQKECPTRLEINNFDVRVLALTRQDLAKQVADNAFREDLYERLKVMHVHMPALRQHSEDIPELVEYFVNQLVTFEGLNYRSFSVSAQNVLRQHTWPANLKELKNVIQRLLILGEGDVQEDEVRELLWHQNQQNLSMGQVVDTSIPLKESKERFEANYISQLLRETSGNVAETAKRSGVDRTNLYRKLKNLGIDPKNPQ